MGECQVQQRLRMAGGSGLKVTPGEAGGQGEARVVGQI